MRTLMMSDIRLLLPHLLDDKDEILRSIQTGRLYGPLLALRRAEIEALPDAGPDPRPLSEALTDTDVIHDATGGAIWSYTEAVLQAPDVSASDRAAAQRIRAAFLPSLSVLQLSYATEAEQARRNRARIAELADDLARFPVPGSSATLASWVERFVSAGERLGDLLVARAELRATAPGRGRAGVLRSEVIGLLTRMRSAMTDELGGDPLRLRTYEAELFGFIDELVARREQSQRRRAVTTEDVVGDAPQAEGTPTDEFLDAVAVAG